MLIQISPFSFNHLPYMFTYASGLFSSGNAIDYFPLIPWSIVMILGILIGYEYIGDENEKCTDDIKENKQVNVMKILLNKIGENSLEIYIAHWIVLYVFFMYFYKK